MTALADVRAALERHGLLLLQDAALPSVATIVAGEVIRGSWWGHPRGKVIFDVLGALEEEALFTKIVQGKVTLVHRRGFEAVVSVGAARSAWQTEGLEPAALALLDRIDGLRSDALDREERRHARELEARLLVHAGQEHSESGKHLRVFSRWESIARARGLSTMPEAEARRWLEEAVASFPARDVGRLLPWQAVSEGLRSSRARSRG